MRIILSNHFNNTLMKKFTFMIIATLMAVATFAQAPAALKQQRHAKTSPTRQLLQQTTVPVGKHRSVKPTLKDMMNKAPRKAASSWNIIYDQPDGELKTYSRSGGYYGVGEDEDGRYLYTDDQAGMTEIVFAANNDVYIKDLLTNFNGVGTWVKGKLSSDGKTITVQMGQPIYYSEEYDAAIVLSMIKYDSTTGFNVDTQTSSAVFTVDDNGVISLQGTARIDVSLGAYWTDDDTIADYGDYETVFTPYTPDLTLVTLPAGLSTTDLPLTGKSVMREGDEAVRTDVSGTVKMARDGDDFYFQGLVPAMPEAWVKGTLDEYGDIAIEPTYIGENATGHVYIMGYSEYAAAANVYLIYDTENNSFELFDFLILNPNGLSVDFNNMYGYYRGLHAGSYPATVAAPQADLFTMPYSGLYYDGDATNFNRAVNVAIDSEYNVYFQGLILEAPEGWIKGQFSEDFTQVIFPSGQFMGVNSATNASIYALGYGIDDEENAVVSDIVFAFDSKVGNFSLLTGLVSSRKSDDLYYIGFYVNVLIGESDHEEWVASQQGYENSEIVNSFTIGSNITATVEKGTGQNDPRYYEADESLRLFAGNTIAFSSTKAMSKIVITMTGEEHQMTLNLTSPEEAYSFADGVGTWTGEATEVAFSVPTGFVNGKTSQARIQKIEVYYVDDSTTPVVVPEDLVTEAYSLTGTDHFDEAKLTYEVKVGFDEANSRVYIQGLSMYLPEAWVSGTIGADGVVSIPSCYLGTYRTSQASYELVFGGATLTYDKAANKFTCPVFYTTDGEYAFDYMEDVVITKVVEMAATPFDPSVYKYDKDSEGYQYVQFYIPTLDTNGNPMLTDKLSYVIWIEKNGQQQQLTLTADLYAEIPADMTEIPYNFTDDYDIVAHGAWIYLNQDAAELASWTKIGIQSIYRGLGEEHKSNIDWYIINPVGTGIQTIGGNDATARYFDLQGRAVNPSAARGIIVKNGKKMVIK